MISPRTSILASSPSRRPGSECPPSGIRNWRASIRQASGHRAATWGVAATCKLCPRGSAGAGVSPRLGVRLGAPLGGRLPSCPPLRWCLREPAAGLAAADAAPAGPRGYCSGSAAGGTLRPPGQAGERAPWIAAAATAVAGDREAVATPAGEPGRRAAAGGSESRDPRARARAGGTAGAPRRGGPARDPPGDARGRRLRLAAGLRPLGLWLAGSSAAALAGSPAPRDSTAPAPAPAPPPPAARPSPALLARSHSTACR